MTMMTQQDTVSSLSGKRIWLKRSRYSDILATNGTQLNTGCSDMKEYRHLTIKQNYQVFPVEDIGVDFVGYRVFPDFILLRGSTAKIMKSKLNRIRHKVESGAEIFYSDYRCFNSYKGWLLYCNSYRLSKKYVVPLEKPME